MKFLIAGLGSIGRRHFRNLLSLGERDILLYRTHSATLPDDELAGFPVETELQAALAHRPDAVIVSNPTALHLDVAIPAAEAGCHLLLEKPLSHSFERLADLRDAVLRNGVRVLVGFQFRFHPTLWKAADLVATGAIGRVISARAHWGEYLPNWHPWEDYRQGYAARPDLGGGVVLTLCHPLDYLRFIVGEVESLWSFTGTLGDLGLDVEDTAEIGLRFKGGALGSVYLDYNQQPPSHRLEITGTAGSLWWDNADAILRWYRPETKAWEIYAPPEGFERNTLFMDEMRHFIAVVRGEATSLCTLDDGVRALQLSLAVLQSARYGRHIKT